MLIKSRLFIFIPILKEKKPVNNKIYVLLPIIELLSTKFEPNLSALSTLLEIRVAILENTKIINFFNSLLHKFVLI